MKKYVMRWTETIVWESKVRANNKKEAESKLHTDEVQNGAEQIKTLSEFDNLEIEEVI